MTLRWSRPYGGVPNAPPDGAPHMRSGSSRAAAGRARRRQRGFTLIEMTVVATVATIFAVYALREVAAQAVSATAQASAGYLSHLRSALDNHMNAHFIALAAGQPVAGYADPLQPTIAELRAQGRLPRGFGDFSPFNIPAALRVTRTDCPGAACRLDGVAWLTQPLQDSQGAPRVGVAGEVRAATPGGLASDIHSPALLRGSTGSFANPLGEQAGVVGVSTSLDMATLNTFVRRADDRPTLLNENLTVNAGVQSPSGVALTVNGHQGVSGGLSVGAGLSVTGGASVGGGDMTVLGADGTACARLSASGALTLSCNGTVSALSGSFGDGSGHLSTITAWGLTASGRVRAQAGLATASATLFDASAPDVVRLSGTRAHLIGSEGTLASFEGGDVLAQRNLSGRRLALREGVSPGQSCAPSTVAAGAGAEFASTSTGGLALCRDGRWVTLADFAVQGSDCSAIGATAVDAATQVGLVCRAFPAAGASVRRWVATHLLLSNFVLVKTESASDQSLVAKPTCAPTGGAFQGTPLLLLQAGNEGSADSGFNRYAIDAGSSWLVRLTDSAGIGLGGARAIAMSYCYYPA